MSGALWAVATGVGFGIFQSINRRAVHGMDAYLSTFLQLVISAVVLGSAAVITGEFALFHSAPLIAWVNFSLAGFFHFFIGWTMLNTSQKKIGASRTSPLIGTTPLFGAVVGFIFFGEVLDLGSWAGILLIISGIYLITRPVNNPGGENQPAAENLNWRVYLFALSASMAWSISPIFIRRGLAVVPSPILGTAVGMVASAIAYVVPLYFRRRSISFGETTRDALGFKLAAGLLVGISTWTRWIALDLSNVATVLAITMISTPIVLLVSPYVMGKQLEKVTALLLSGAGLVLSGALILVLIP